MTIGEFFILLAMAAILGVITQRMLGYKLGGMFVSIFLGFIGAYVGKEMTGWFHLPIIFDVGIGDHRFPVIWSFLGCLVVTFVVGFIAKGASKHDKKKK
jgi:uncharacterized membrane protein YeaQ/YmgE (transglycosylase-associated protein family)